ncbi:MAG: transglycosylase SLT domain-containing protein [Blastocatellia bacterium]
MTRKPAFLLPSLVCVVLLSGMAHTAAAETVTSRHDDTFRKYSKRFFGPGFDWRLFKAQGMAESNLSMAAKSHVGARGIMQLMPTTYREIQSKNPEIKTINDPEWNIAGGIYYNRQLWTQWTGESGEPDRHRFMLASYNAGRGTLRRAQDVARARTLDPSIWPSIRAVAPEVPRWRHTETLSYIERIEANLTRMNGEGHIP